MKVHLIQSGIQDFLQHQGKTASDDWYFPHSLVDHFNVHWYEDPQRPLKEKYDQCLKSEISQRWWKREHYRPKEIMLQLFDADPELAAIAWKDLQQPNASLDGRLSRFTYYCDQLLSMHRDQHFRAIETYHHQDAAILSLYLAGLFPEQFTLYPGLAAFQSFCKNIGSPDIPKVDDLVRYMKIAGIVHSYVQRDDQYEQLMESRNAAMHKIKCIPMVVVYEVICFISDRASTHMS